MMCRKTLVMFYRVFSAEYLSAQLRKPHFRAVEIIMNSESEHAQTRYSCACCLNSFDAVASAQISPQCPYCRTNQSVAVASSSRTLLLLLAAPFICAIAVGWCFRLSIPKPPIVASPPSVTSSVLKSGRSEPIRANKEVNPNGGSGGF